MATRRSLVVRSAFIVTSLRVDRKWWIDLLDAAGGPLRLGPRVEGYRCRTVPLPRHLVLPLLAQRHGRLLQRGRQLLERESRWLERALSLFRGEQRQEARVVTHAWLGKIPPPPQT